MQSMPMPELQPSENKPENEKKRKEKKN